MVTPDHRCGGEVILGLAAAHAALGHLELGEKLDARSARRFSMRPASSSAWRHRRSGDQPGRGAALTGRLALPSRGRRDHRCRRNDGVRPRRVERKDGQPFAGTFTSANGQFTLSVTDSGVSVVGPGTSIKVDSSTSTVITPRTFPATGTSRSPGIAPRRSRATRTSRLPGTECSRPQARLLRRSRRPLSPTAAARRAPLRTRTRSR